MSPMNKICYIISLILVSSVVGSTVIIGTMQVDGMTIGVGPNGMMGMTQNGTNYGTITAPSGTPVESIRVVPTIYTHLNGTWQYFNGTSKASGTITFGSDLVSNNNWNERAYDFMAYTNGKLFAGTYQFPGDWVSLCHAHSHGHGKHYSDTECTLLSQPLGKPVQSWTANHIELVDQHNDTIYLDHQ